MPVVGLRQRVPCPVGCLEIFENDSRVFVFFRRLAPDIKVSVNEVLVTVGGCVDPGGTGKYGLLAAVNAGGCNAVTCNCASRFLEPRILIGSMIDHEFSDHTQIPVMRGVEKRSEIIERAEIRIY